MTALIFYENSHPKVVEAVPFLPKIDMNQACVGFSGNDYKNYSNKRMAFQKSEIHIFKVMGAHLRQI